MYDESVYPENFLTTNLQQYMTFFINGRLIKRGRLLLFKRQHYYIQLALLNDKNARENFDIPIPFEIEVHPEDHLAYFDYRLEALRAENLPILPKKVSSSFFNKILEVSIS